MSKNNLQGSVFRIISYDMHVGTVKIFSGANDKELSRTICNFFRPDMKIEITSCLNALLSHLACPKKDDFDFSIAETKPKCFIVIYPERTFSLRVLIHVI